MVSHMYEELVRGLRRCSYTTVAGCDREDGYCKPCAYFKSDGDITCMDMMMIDAADAIEDLQKEVERLKPYEEKWIGLLDCVHEGLKDACEIMRWDGDPNIKVFKEAEDEA